MIAILIEKIVPSINIIITFIILRHIDRRIFVFIDFLSSPVHIPLHGTL